MTRPPSPAYRTARNGRNGRTGRRLTVTGAVAALTVAAGLAGPSGSAAPVAEPPSTDLPARHLDLPDGFQPEGIAIRGGVAYLGSRADGALVRVDLGTGVVGELAEGPGTPSLGLKADGKGRLFVAGGSGGDLRVVDASSGEQLKRYRLVRGAAFVNDVLLTERAVYATDSANDQLYRLPLGRGGRLPARADVERLPLRGAWQQLEGNNANGLTTTPNGRALLVVNSANGVLYRYGLDSDRVTRVDLGGATLAGGDGLLREGTDLFAVQNRLNQVAVVRLSDSGRAGTVSRTLSTADFDVPATVARYRGRLYLPNARFTTEATPATPYWISGIPVPR